MPQFQFKRASVVAAIATCVMWAAGCGDGPTDPPAATTVSVTPADAELAALEATVQLTAQVTDQYGQVMSGVPVSWSSADAQVATVDRSGRVVSTGNGAVTITAAAGSASGTAAVTVAQVVTAVAVSPGADTLVAFGDTVRLVAHATDVNGHTVVGAEFMWSSTDTLVATVDSAGLLTALGRGTATVTAKAGDAIGPALVTVAQVVAAVTVSPGADTLVAFGDTARFAAEAMDVNGHVVEEAEFTWSSGDTLVATVDSSGLLTAVGHGTAIVTAASGDATGPALVTVRQAVGSVVVSPARDTVPLGDTLRLVAEAFDGNGHVIDGAAFEWSSSDISMARVDALGLVTGLAEGTVIVTAVAGDVSGAAEVTVWENPDRAALVALYHATDGPNWLDNTNWLTDAPLGEWYGVNTDRLGRVRSVDLGGHWAGVEPHGLTGPIPPELGDLSNLEVLSLHDNDLTGPIPPELGNLSNLEYLYLSANDLSGPIPPKLGNLSNLRWLGLSFNSLTGPIPSELGELSNLRHLRLYRNSLTGPIPPELGDLSNLEELHLHDNGLTGLIPPELGNLSNLYWLEVQDNDLSGLIPPELGNLSNLRWLDVQDNDLSGPIPPELGDLSNLRLLDVQDNDLSGPIPPELGDLSNLNYLYLSGNDLSGPIPPELGDLSNLEKLYLGGNDLTGPIPPQLGNLASLELLFLELNRLSGAIPPELGGLASLEWMSLRSNELTGALPRTLLDLSLERFIARGNALCVPGTREFVEWMDQLQRPADVSFCNEPDRAALAKLFDVTGGRKWTESDGWLRTQVLDEWHGVTADSLGRVTELHLSSNGLSGPLAINWGDLTQLVGIRINGNPLSGRLPVSLTSLLLREFRYADTELCEPADIAFREWLNGIESHEGTGVECAPLTDRDVLEALFWNTGGRYWNRRRNWLSSAPLDYWHGVEVDDSGRVTMLSLHDNDLTGPIPPELGELSNLRNLGLGRNELSGPIPLELGGLSNLESLDLFDNDLSGPIPPELGELSNLRNLWLDGNALSGPIPSELGELSNLRNLGLRGTYLSGPIPPELGELSNLRNLGLGRNELSGPIPLELGGLSNLESLDLFDNDLSGPIPPELGELPKLEFLALSHNDLSGPMPPEFGGLASLRELRLTGNAGLAGPLPASVTSIRLESLQAGGTDLCAPRLEAFEAWLATIPSRWIPLCDPPAAYLVQAVQSRTHQVPLVAGEDALLRVFVTAQTETTAGIPEVRARFYRNGAERHVAEIPASSTPIPTEVDEGDLSKSANAVIPGRIVRPGLQMVIEIDPGGTLDASLGVAARIPEEGRMAVEVRQMPTLELTVIPFLWRSLPDSAIIGLVEGMVADPEGHFLLEETRVLLPVADIDVTAHAPVASASNNAYDLLSRTQAIRVLEGGGGHYMGMMSGTVTGASGVAKTPGWSSFSEPYSRVIGHELGHNMSLGHAPCGGAGGPDPSFPYRHGSIGAWGYNHRRHLPVAPHRNADHMGYCVPAWTSDYHFTNALRHRLIEEAGSSAALASAPATALLLWGGVDTAGVPFLNPAFVADAPPALPDSAGDWTVTGRDAGNREIFSLSFTMPLAQAEEADVSSFVFALPVRPGWADALASVTLSSPDGTATLDGDSDMPMAILRDPVTGQVRGFLDDPATVAAGTAGLDVLFSRGIPDAAAWRR